MRKKCIVLNKPFRGSYLGDDEHEAHEIINFFLTDEGDHFIYNNPYGQNVSEADKYDIKYMIFTSEMIGDRFYIQYVCKIKSSLHGQSISKKTLAINGYLDDVVKDAETQIKTNLPKKYKQDLKNVKYGGTPIKNFFHDNTKAIPLTYLAEKMYKVKKPVLIDTNKRKSKDGNPKKVYHFQRNFGYVTNQGKSKYVYQKINKAIKGIIERNNLDSCEIQEFEPRKHNSKSPEYRCLAKTTFLDFIALTHLEEAYTKMIANLFNSVPGLFESFLSSLKPQDTNGENLTVHSEKDEDNFSSETPHDGYYPVLSEVTIPYVGRLDLFYTNHNQNVVIENKIDSLLTENHEIQDSPENKTDDEAKKEKNEMRGMDQLSRYYLHFSKYAKERKETLYFLLAPENHLSILKQDMLNRNANLTKFYKFIGYGSLEEFFRRHKNDLKKGKYHNYVDDALLLLKRLSLTDKERCEIKLAINANKKRNLD